MKNLGVMIFALTVPFLLSSCAHTSKPHDSSSTKSTPAVRTGYAPVNGLKMYYEIHGAGKPLVLIHGGGSTIDSNFSKLIPLLRDKYQIIALEEQGHGHTAAIDRPFTFENSADDVAALLAYLKIEKADVFGFSNGGSIAMRLAQRHPDKVNRLIVASAMYRRDGMMKGFWDMFRDPKLEMMPQLLQDADRKINPDPKHLEQMFWQDTNRMRAFRDWPAADMKKIKSPTLFVVGDQDVVRVHHVIQMNQLVSGSRMTVLPAGHGDYLGEVASSASATRFPEATAILIDEFLSARAK